MALINCMVSDIYALKSFVEENKIEDKAILDKEKLFTYLIIETKHAPYTINLSLNFFVTLGFLEKKESGKYLFNKTKFDEFLKRDQ